MDSIITIIAAVGRNNELGKNNKLIWQFKKDMAFFKEQTLDKTVFMGLNTLKSLPHLLVRRKHIVLSNDPSYILPDNVVTIYSLQNALNYIETLHKEVFVCGGASIYAQMLPYADRLLLTEIDDSADADVYFPDFDKSKYVRTILGRDSENGINFEFVEYKKK